MIMKLSEKHCLYQKEFSDFVRREITPHAAGNDREEKVSRELIGLVAEKGYLGAMIPEKYGGLGLDMFTLGLLNEEMGKGCSSVRGLLTVHGMTALGILKWGSDEQRELWLPGLASGEKIGAFALTEPNTGSDAKSIESTAVRDGDGFVLNGVKKWITMGQIADVFLAFLQLDGKPTAFLLERDRPGVEIVPVRGLMGMRASMSAEIHMKNCRIPEGCILGKPGTGLSHVAMTCLDYGRYTVACGCVGLGQACLEACVEYARKRKQFGEPLRKHQLIQKMIAEMVTSVQASRLLCYRAGYLKDEGDPESIIETWIAKYHSAGMVSKVTSDAVLLHGANGCHEGYPVERFYRDAKINEIIEGTAQMHEILISMNTIRGCGQI